MDDHYGEGLQSIARRKRSQAENSSGNTKTSAFGNLFKCRWLGYS